MTVFQIGIILVIIGLPLDSVGQMNRKAKEDLKNLLDTEKEWVKVHVAEFLIWEGYDSTFVYQTFLREERQYGHIPKYRIGIWRVLAQAAPNETESQYWVDRIVSAYQDREGPDRLHAIETLAKLQVFVVHKVDDTLEGSMRLYTLWNYALGSENAQEEVKAILLRDLIDDRLEDLEMQVTSYIFRYLGLLSDEQFVKIYEWMQAKNFNPSLCSNLLTTLWISFPENGDSDALHMLKKELIALRSQPEALNHIMMALAMCGDSYDRKIICELYETLSDTNQPDYNSDLHATAAYMALKVPDKVVSD